MFGTARQAYVDILTELVKEEAPTLYLEDFLYFYNKAISEYLKVRYELFEATQQLTDDLRFWKKRYVDTRLEFPISDIGLADGHEYRHLLSCTLDASISRPVLHCDQQPGVASRYKATRMSSAVKAGLLNYTYLEPKFYRPYFDILDNNVRLSIGDVPAAVTISGVEVEYLKQPVLVDLTEAQINEDIDNSQVLEFTTDVGDEINKIILELLLERGMNPRLQSNIAVAQSVNDIALRGGQK